MDCRKGVGTWTTWEWNIKGQKGDGSLADRLALVAPSAFPAVTASVPIASKPGPANSVCTVGGTQRLLNSTRDKAGLIAP